MSLANSKKPANGGLHQGFEVMGAVARMRRGGMSNRSGRRAALLSMMSASYTNTARTASTANRPNGSTDRG